MIHHLLRALPAAGWMLVIFALSSQSSVSQPFGVSTFLLTVVAHLVLYGVLAVLLLFAFQRDGQITRSAQIAAVVGALLYGVTDEFHQSFVPGRDASVFDLVVNTIGATIAVAAWMRIRLLLPGLLTR